MKRTFEYNLPMNVIKFLTNLASTKIFGESLISVGEIVSLKDYDQNEVNRCYFDCISFMTNAKKNNRKVYIA